MILIAIGSLKIGDGLWYLSNELCVFYPRAFGKFCNSNMIDYNFTFTFCPKRYISATKHLRITFAQCQVHVLLWDWFHTFSVCMVFFTWPKVIFLLASKYCFFTIQMVFLNELTLTLWGLWDNKIVCMITFLRHYLLIALEGFIDNDIWQI